MALNGVLSNALSGIRTTQLGLEVVSQNVANADAIGYVRRQTNTVEQVYGNATGGVRNGAIQRLLDTAIQKQMWSERSGAGYTSAQADFARALDQLYGAPDADTSLNATFSRFTQSLQQLQADPSSATLRTGVVAAAGDLTGLLRSLSAGIQDLRSQAEAGLASGAERVNELLGQLEAVNAKVVAAGSTNAAAALRDERDRIVTELSGYLDLRVSENASGSLSLFTNSGVQLFDGKRALTITFDARPSLSADAIWNADDALRGVGTLRAVDHMGGSYDLIANKALRSGELAALVDMRDRVLVQAQAQLDELAAGLASALSDRQVAGTAVTVGGQGGFDVDLAGLSPGNQVTFDYVDAQGRAQRVTLVRAENAASAAAVGTSGLGSSDNRFVGIDFSQPMAGIAAQVQAALGPGFTASTPGGTTLRVLGGTGGTAQALTARPTTTGFATGAAELPFFTDPMAGNAAYTGSFENGSQLVGFASRIEVNPALIADRSRLVQYTPTTAQGDQTRPELILDRLINDSRSFSPLTGLSGADQSVRTTVATFAQRIVDDQSLTVEGILRLDEGQQVALRSVEARFAEKSAVSVDSEMADLIQLQAAYAANARIITAVKEMMDLLLRL